MTYVKDDASGKAIYTADIRKDCYMLNFQNGDCERMTSDIYPDDNIHDNLGFYPVITEYSSYSEFQFKRFEYDETSEESFVEANDLLDMITVYFVNSPGWQTVKIYTWGDHHVGNWPGMQMSFVRKEATTGYDIYKAKIPAPVDGIVINDNQYNYYQTEDITEDIEDGKGWYAPDNDLSDGFDMEVKSFDYSDDFAFDENAFPEFRWNDNGDGSVTITKYLGNGLDVVIPDELDGKTVTSIRYNTFSGKTGITSVTMPDTITSIGNSAFADCTNLASVTLSKGLISIGSAAFKNTALTSIEIPKSLNSAGYSSTYYTIDGTEYYFNYGPFGFCEDLTTVTFEEGTTKIPQWLFAGCTGLTSITVPDTVTMIGQSAFKFCVNLKKADLGASTVTIGSNAFENCFSLDDLTLPDTVSVINQYAFNSCRSLKTVTLPKQLENLGGCAFGYTAIETVEIPKSLTGAGYTNTYYTYDGTEYNIYCGPFCFCDSLTTATFEEGATIVGPYLFAGCTGLTSITLPDTVTTVDQSAFRYCVNLTKADLGKSVATIGSYAFDSCFSLDDLTLSDTTATINQNAFNLCKKLKDQMNIT